MSSGGCCCFKLSISQINKKTPIKKVVEKALGSNILPKHIEEMGGKAIYSVWTQETKPSFCVRGGLLEARATFIHQSIPFQNKSELRGASYSLPNLCSCESIFHFFWFSSFPHSSWVTELGNGRGWNLYMKEKMVTLWLWLSLISVCHQICFTKYLCILLFGCQPKFLLCQSLAASGVGAPTWARAIF